MHGFLRNRPALAGLLVVAATVAVAILAPLIAPHDPLKVDLGKRFLPGFWDGGAGGEFPLGADALGRDILSRLIHGSRISLLAGLASVAISVVFGLLVGVAAGFRGGRLDDVLMRLMDMLLAFPPLILALAIVAILGPSLSNAMVAVGAVNAPGVARLARGVVLRIKEADFVHAARALGAREIRVLRLCVLPSLISPITVYGSLLIGRAILTLASLSFLGLGALPPTPEWGAMLADARDVLLFGKWWVAAFPGLAIMILVLGLNLMGDGVSEAADPRLRRYVERGGAR